ncbi:hypothetical protein [Streptococcus jiangjianxini]|uniref:hypothetical protein n=1 Tax=Streptococcus jiangjianxini TaxID=3161189 RepID=UPI0032EBF79B
MTKILVVSYHYPPFEGSCSDKNIRIVKKLLNSGFEVVVLTKHAITDDEKMDKFTVIRTESNGVFHKNIDKIPTSISSNSNGFNYKRLISDNLIPDSAIDWFPEAKKTFKKNKDNFTDVDLILSISSPYSAHLVSSYIAKKLNKPYIMVYGDPWLYEPKRKRGFFRYRLEKLMEQKLVQKASKVLLITEWNKKKYQELYNLPENKVVTYHIGFDPLDRISWDSSINSREGEQRTLKIIYGGSLDEVHRDPRPFLEAMKNIENIHLSIYNSDNSKIAEFIKKYDLEDKVTLSPLVSSSKFNELLNHNDTLLLFGNRTPFQVPGKVFNYIATGKTIIYVKNNSYDNDGTKEVLEKYSNYLLIDNTVESIVSNIRQFQKNKQRESNISQFSYNETMQPIADAINDVLGIEHE